MRRIVIAVGLCGILTACGQEAQPVAPGGAPGQPLDYIDAVPIDKNAPLPAPVARPEPAAKKEEPRAAETAEKSDAEAVPVRAPAPAVTPRPAAPANDAASATRRANEAVAPRSSTEVPYSPN